MWEDFKKIGGLVFSQSKEQKDILMLKLRIISFDNKKDSALTRLGSLVFKAIKEGVNAPLEDAKVAEQLKELDEIEEEMESSNKLLGELREKTKEEREELATHLGDTWDKTKETLSSMKPSAEKPKEEPAPEKSSEGKGAAEKKAEPKSAGGKKSAKKSAAKKQSKKDVE